MGEFGAVSVVSGHIRGETNTMPLHVEVHYNEYNFVAAFAVASLLAPPRPCYTGPQKRARVEIPRPDRCTTLTCRSASGISPRAFRPIRHSTACRWTSKTASFVALLRPSGSGKTTLLRIIAGLETPVAGQILFRGRDVTQTSIASRGIGFVLQHYALFGHMTVAQNIAFGLSVMRGSARPHKDAIRTRVGELLEIVQLPGIEARYPSQLSGGQRQRVALARALARDPQILLLDEPFGALDAKVRRELRTALRAIHSSLGLTSIFVTHDHEEAFSLV